ncbi:hypothetical protein SLE2022_135120 [Rubroshorea leprosula]
MEDKEISLEMKLEKEMKSLDADMPVQLTPLIQGVTNILKDNLDFQRYFKPICVAFGPLHHDDSPNSRLQRGEKKKLQMAAKYIEYSGMTKEVFYSNVMAELNSLKECYDSEQIKKWSDEYIAWMFLVDGCAVLFFIDHVATKNLEALGGKDDLLPYVKLDLFLLENQLPYRLLQIFMSSCTRVPRNPPLVEKYKNEYPPAEVLEASITKFINKNVIFIKKDATCQQRQPQQHSKILNDQTHQQQQQRLQQQLEIMVDQTQHHQQQQNRERDPAHLLELLWRRMTKSEKDKESDGTMSKGISSNSNPDGKNRLYWSKFRNVKELKEKGISIKVSESSSIRDISFQEYFFMATLSLPSITVDDFTVPKLMNLIAYEMCPDFENKLEITSYVSFLDSLIDQDEDVKELRHTGVLHHGLGSDGAVALLFNEIRKNLVPNLKLHSKLKKRIQRHCHTAVSTHAAELYHTYFRSPWSILALLGVLLGLVLTAVQTFSNPPTPAPGPSRC